MLCSNAMDEKSSLRLGRKAIAISQSTRMSLADSGTSPDTGVWVRIGTRRPLRAPYPGGFFGTNRPSRRPLPTISADSIFENELEEAIATNSTTKCLAVMSATTMPSSTPPSSGSVPAPPGPSLGRWIASSASEPTRPVSPRSVQRWRQHVHSLWYGTVRRPIPVPGQTPWTPRRVGPVRSAENESVGF